MGGQAARLQEVPSGEPVLKKRKKRRPRKLTWNLRHKLMAAGFADPVRTPTQKPAQKRKNSTDEEKDASSPPHKPLQEDEKMGIPSQETLEHIESDDKTPDDSNGGIKPSPPPREPVLGKQSFVGKHLTVTNAKNVGKKVAVVAAYGAAGAGVVVVGNKLTQKYDAWRDARAAAKAADADESSD